MFYDHLTSDSIDSLLVFFDLEFKVNFDNSLKTFTFKVFISIS